MLSTVNLNNVNTNLGIGRQLRSDIGGAYIANMNKFRLQLEVEISNFYIEKFTCSLLAGGYHEKITMKRLQLKFEISFPEGGYHDEHIAIES